MSPREKLPKGLASQRYRAFFEAFGKQDFPYQPSGRDEYAFLWEQWQRAKRAERPAPMTWFDTSTSPVRPAIPAPEEPPEPEEETVAPPAPKKRSQSRFKNLEL